MSKILDDASAERLWKMFFPWMTRACGMALVEELIQIHARKNSKKPAKPAYEQP